MVKLNKKKEVLLIMKNIPEFDWNEEQGTATCILTDKNKKIYIGFATCHPDDQDMCSEKTGCEIALSRATIDYYRNLRDNEIKPALAALNQLYYSMNKSKSFNPNSYENKMLQRQIRLKTFDLTTVQEMIVAEQEKLKNFIKKKEEFYQLIRSKRRVEAKIEQLSENKN